jgi:NAD(P)-dependent dehydrogenase (short-subunit alcohol dehydrogenase family)
MELSGASAIVTGGASGIGAASARALTRRGARCVLVDLNEDLGKQVAADLDGIYVHADVTDEADVAQAVAATADLGPLRALVNAAGIGNAIRTVDRERGPFPLEKFEKVVRVNLIGTFNCLRLAAAAMAQTEPVDADGTRGAIVNLSSVAAFDGQIGQAAYAASKGGIVALTLPAAREFARSGIRVNTIAPGLFATPLLLGMPQTVQESLASSVPFPSRFGTPEEYARLVLHIVDNAMLNGETIRLDGALRMQPK